MEENKMKKTDRNCIFCKLANHEIPTNVVYEDEFVLAFLDNSPTSKGHTLVITKEHFENILCCPPNLLSHVFLVCQKIAHSMVTTLGADGFNILNNCNECAGQTIKHFHVHIIPRYSSDKRKMLEFSPYQIEDKEYLQIADSIKQGIE